METDQINIPNYSFALRSNCRGVRNSEGALILAKDGIHFQENPEIHVDYTNSGHCVIVPWRISNVQMIMCYKSPKYSKSQFVRKLKEALEKSRGTVVVFGDININLQEESGQQFRQLMQSLNLESKLNFQDPTTDYGTHIDCCFSNVPGLEAWLYESYFSYHKPICMILPKV